MEPDRPPTDDEARRVARVYGRYRESVGKRRAWSAENPGNSAIRRELVETAFSMAGEDLHGAEAILDVGCGSGWWLQTLAERGDLHARLHGVEILPARVQIASERVPSATVTAADARALPYPDAHFQVLSLFTVLSSLAEHAAIRAALIEGWRVLAPGGVLLVWEPRIPNPGNRQTRTVSLRAVREALPDGSIELRTTTLVPALARRLGSHTDEIYPRLARVAGLRTHRLIAARRPPPRR